eukprot:gene20359-22367_t
MDLSDEEKHALELRRERSNKISKLMGEYLLKGYKMLGSTCNKCGTILMRDRQQNDYCVSCHDIDSISSNMDADLLMQSNDNTSGSRPRVHMSRADNTERNEQVNHSAVAYSMSNSTDDFRGILKGIQCSVFMKMRSAAAELQSASMDDSFKLLELIKACQETLNNLKPLT